MLLRAIAFRQRRAGEERHEIDVAGSMAEAKHLLGAVARKNDAYDVVLLDLGLPDCDAEYTYDRLRTVAPDLPIIVYSGHEDAHLVTRMLEAGAADCIRKSLAVKGEDVIAKLERVGQNARQVREASEATRAAEQALAAYEPPPPVEVAPTTQPSRHSTPQQLPATTTPTPRKTQSLDDVTLANKAKLLGVGAAIAAGAAIVVRILIDWRVGEWIFP